MSDLLLRFVPAEQGRNPKTWTRAADLVRAAIPSNECVTVEGTGRITFVHDYNGRAYKVRCGCCEADVRKWFSGLLRTTVEADCAFEFDRLDTVMPCCEVSSSLDTLRFDIPVAWADRWVQVMNPMAECPDQLLAALCDQLAGVLGCEVRAILVWD